MKLTQLTFSFDDENEIEFYFAGEYGRKGEKRAPRRKRTPDEMKRQNQKNRVNRLRRKIKKNFHAYDLWITLKYPAGTKKSVKELKADFANFRKKLSRRYKKHGVEMKYIYRMEIGKNGGLHVHIILNRIVGAPMDVYIDECWKGRAWHTNLYEEGGFDDLAEYIAKQPSKEIEGQLSLFPEEEQGKLIEFNCSRNLEIPVPERKTFNHWTMRRFLDEDEEPVPTEGYMILKDSIVKGVNPYTGLSFLRYREVKIDSGGRYEESKHISGILS